MNRYLFVIDYQNDFVDGALGFPGAEKLDKKIAAKIRSYGEGKVLFTRDTHFENYLDTREGKNLPVPHCIKGSDGWELDSKVQAALDKKGFTAIEKPTFGSVDLPEYIRKNYNADEIEIELIGLCTDICVVSNALIIKATYPEIKVSVDASCCAGVTPESHEAALTTMRMCQVEITGE